MMPDGSGVELLQRVRAANAEQAACFVLMTGGAFTERARRALEDEDVICLEKPIARATLLQLVSTRLGG